MDKIESYVEEVLEGNALYDDSASIVDYSLEEQIGELAAKGVESSVSDYKPVIKKSVTYIVAVVLVNENDEVLMMQEAKRSCAGTWYLPAGRMEPGEDILDAAKREVLEETGLEFEPTTLLMVESAQGHWYRFVVTGNVTGGELKTVSRADSESLQATWIDDLKQLDLRALDILPLIEKAREYSKRQNEAWHEPLLPSIHPHDALLLRTLFFIRKRENNKIHVLVSEKEAAHLPLCEINPTRSVHAALKKFVTSIFGPETPPHKPHGVLSVEHSGQPEDELDGLCLTLLISCKTPLEDVKIAPMYTWLELSRPLGEKLLYRMGKNLTVCLNIIK
ncbi:8-oxo-dGDP phosphatase NUDT18 [Tachypleus tridentatus]|uniref:8-oxo-dGDP phosphatase NUDT18 n=1 Tax=Tachypleus tridentatus TaxID=6853 RepID=UPI003FCF562A